MSEMVKELHVVMLPLPAFGHLMPFFQLSIALAKAKVHVSFISTPRNIERLPKIPSDLQPFINLVSIPFPPLEPDFLPEGAEASFDVPEQQEQQYENLQVAVDLLQTPIKQFIAEKMPDWIIADFFTHWVVDIAKEYDVPLAYFSVFSAATCVFFGPPEHLTGAIRNGVLPTTQSLTSPPEWITFPSLLALKDYEAVKRLLSWEVNKTGMSLNRRLAKIVSASQVLAIRTCSEIEGDYLEVYKKITGKPVIPTGVLPPDQPGKRAEGEVNSDASTCKTFMDKEGARQQQLLSFIPRHHKHYILPNSVNKKVHFSPHVQTDTRQHAYQARPHVQPSSAAASKTLSWHLASETKSTLKGTSQALASSADTKISVNTSGVFQLLDNEGTATTKSSGAHLQLPSRVPGSESFVAGHRDAVDGYRPLGAARSFDNQNRQIVRVPVRSKSLLSAFFVKQKSTKLKTGSVS